MLDLCKTPEERAVFEELKSMIGKEFVPHPMVHSQRRLQCPLVR